METRVNERATGDFKLTKTKRLEPRQHFGLRIRADERRLIEVAAFGCGESVGGFIRRAAVVAAKEALAK